MPSLTFDFDQLTSRMLIDFADATGVELMSLLDGDGLDIGALPAKCQAGVIWLGMRMSGQPAATWDDALDVPLSDLVFAEEPGPDPTDASGTT